LVNDGLFVSALCLLQLRFLCFVEGKCPRIFLFNFLDCGIPYFQPQSSFLRFSVSLAPDPVDMSGFIEMLFMSDQVLGNVFTFLTNDQPFQPAVFSATSFIDLFLCLHLKLCLGAELRRLLLSSPVVHAVAHDAAA